MRYDIIVSGYVSLDRVIKVATELIPGKTSIVTNDNNVNLEYGGCGINFACDLDKLGKSVLPVIRVGFDYAQSGFKQFLEVNNISTEAVEIIDKAATSCSYLIEDKEMNHVTLYYPGAMHEKYFNGYKEEWFKVSKLGLMTVASVVDNKEFLTMCKQVKIPHYLGLKMDEAAFPQWFVKEVTESVNGVFANEVEYEYFLKSNQVSNIKEIFEINKQLEFVVKTKGKLGSEIYFKEKNRIIHLEVPVLETNEFVSSVGSGDAFMAGFLFGMLEGYSKKECMYLGATLSTFIIEAAGATSNAPDRLELLYRFNRFFKESE
jgi:adenosine kinase